MGKTSKFFKALFGFKPPEPGSDHQTKRRWSFFKSHHQNNNKPNHLFYTPRHHRTSDGSANHAIPVAAADAAVVATHVAVGGSGYGGLNGEVAAVKIQAYYRGYLARKALRALKSLVKLQRLVRGHLKRKQATDDLRRLQDLVRTQARARACRVQITESPQSATKGPATPEKFEHGHRSRVMKHYQPSTLKNNYSRLYDDRAEKVLEMDTMKSHTRRRNLFHPDQISYSHSQSLTTSQGSTIHSCDVSSLTGPLKWFPHDYEEQVSLSTAQNSPPFYANSYKTSYKNGQMKIGLFTPAKSDSSRSCLSGYSDHPNYMAYTESSRAKVRSISAPRQRPNLEFPSTTKRYSVYGYGSGGQRGPNLRDNFVNKAYPGSGRLDRLGMPVGGVGFRESEFSGGYWN